MTRRSLILRILLAVALGGATSIAIAWALAYWSPWSNPRCGDAMFAPRGSDVSSVGVSQYWQPGLLLRRISSGEDSPRFVAWDTPTTERLVEVLSRNDVDDWWGAARRGLRLGEAVTVIEEARGWPFLCLYSWRDPSNRTSGGASIRIRGEDIWGDDAKVLPTLPIWRGLALNSAAFAALWLIPLTVPSAWVARRRRRRGRCPRCSYDLRADPAGGCPECGWARVPAHGDRT